MASIARRTDSRGRTMSKVQKMQAQEEKERREAIKAQKHQAYLQRAQRRNRNKVPEWVRERDAQLKESRTKAIASGEFVIHMKPRRAQPTRRTIAAHVDMPKEAKKHVATKNAFDALDSSDESDEEVEVQEDYPVLMGKEVAVKPAAWPRVASLRPKPIATPKVHPEEAAEKSVEKIQQKDSMGRPVVDNSAWSDGEEETKTTTVFTQDPSLFNADGSKKSWAELCDSDDDW